MPAQPTATQLDAARDAYHRYAAVTDFKNYQGNQMPAFAELPFTIQCAWAAAADTSYDFKANT